MEKAKEKRRTADVLVLGSQYRTAEPGRSKQIGGAIRSFLWARKPQAQKMAEGLRRDIRPRPGERGGTFQMLWRWPRIG